MGKKGKYLWLIHFAFLFSFSSFAQTTTIIPFGANWKYLDNGSDQDTVWRLKSFIDTAWKAGEALLGYGEGDETTKISFGPESDNKYITTYFRKTIIIENADIFNNYKLNVYRDDGIVVYINGEEAYRNMMPEGAIAYNTFANKAEDDGKIVQSTQLQGSKFISGENLIAVEIHQRNRINSDIRFDLELIADSLIKDTIPPKLTSIKRYNPLEESITNQSVIFRAIFSEPVTGIDASDFILQGTAKGQIASIKGTADTFDIAINAITENGTLRLNIKDSGTNITDTAGNFLLTENAELQTYNILKPATDSLLIPYQSSWKYLDNGSDQGSLWKDKTFNDDLWSTGTGKFGYGIADANTIVKGQQTANYISTYFRKAFNIDNLNGYTSFKLQVKKDDGILIYINGKEVYRNDLPTGNINYTTLATDNDNGTTEKTITVAPSLFVNGTNIIAAEIHQANVTNDDMAFDLQLIGNSHHELTRGPYLQIANQSGVTLRWRTDIAIDSKIEVGTAYGNYVVSAINQDKTTEHELRIDGLQSGTKYFYRFGSSHYPLESDVENYFYTAPAPNSKSKTKIAVFGDCGRNDNNNQLGSLKSYQNFVGNNPAQLLLLLGDNAYENGSDAEYQKYFFKVFSSNILKNHVLFPTSGNHEFDLTGKSSESAAYFKIFSVPMQGESGGVASNNRSYYSFDWGNIHFLSLDSYGIESDGKQLYDTTGMQAKWVKQDLAANTKEWTIAYFHNPPYTMGSHNSDTESDLVKMRKNFIRILERYGVDLVLSGHSHDYERSYLLNNYYGYENDFNLSVHAKSSSSGKYDDSNNSCPYLVSSKKENHGTVYVVTGSAGASGNVQKNYPHNALPFAINDGGMFYIEVEDNRLDAKFLRKDGSIYDQFTILHDVDKTIDTTIAYGQPIQLTASWNGTYKWSNGSTEKSITAYPTTNTTYKVTDEFGCIADQFNVHPEQTSRRTDITKINEQSASMLVYPTNAKRGTVISVRSNFAIPTEAKLLNANGVELATYKFTGVANIHTEKLATGVYFIVLKNKENSITQKIIVSE